MKKEIVETPSIPSFVGSFGKHKERQWFVIPTLNGRVMASSEDVLCIFDKFGKGELYTKRRTKDMQFDQDFVTKAMEVCPPISEFLFDGELEIFNAIA